MAGVTPKKEPTANEAMFFFAIVKHMRNKADIDWPAVAAEQGFKNAEVAKVRFGQVKRKLGFSDTAGARSSAKSTPTKSGAATGRVTKTTPKKGSAKGKKPKQEQEQDGDDGDVSSGDTDCFSPRTPSKRAKSPPMKAENGEDYPDSEECADMP